MRIVFLGINKIGRLVRDYLVDQGEDVLTTATELYGVGDVLHVHRPDVVICGGFRHILPQEVVEEFLCINMHKALLPWNRGSNPSYWTIRDGTPAGVTIHLMDKGIDTGPILAQQEIEVLPSDTSRTLYDRLEKAQLELFASWWPRFRHEGLSHLPSPLVEGTYHEKADMVVDRLVQKESMWLIGAVLDKLRAGTHDPFHNLYFIEDGQRYYLRLQIYQPDDEAPTDGDLKQYPEVRP